jgi:hypothetical protein
MSTLYLTKFPYAFTSRIEDIRISMEDLSSYSEVESSRLLVWADSKRWSPKGALSLVFNSRSRAVADRETRPGLK